ncbi:hypothetical protein Patl1_14967 [Pistacia atlantica]|uniref:Uncharacterized protein n=1 Tax=Pistacia atlantica TaxID=434234 RepID=A0ACC1B8K7_9ROSI|nr:hypothetical protein Patl1_14967 [Pistacia atlantica]
MNQCAIQQNIVAGREEMRTSVSDRRDHVVCPKPRRLGVLHATINDPQPVRSLRWNLSHQSEALDPRAGSDLFDIILPKGGYGGMEQSCTQMRRSSPPVSPVQLSLSPSSSRKTGGGGGGGGCVRPNFVNKPAVRIEGFDCRDRRNCSIPALA